MDFEKVLAVEHVFLVDDREERLDARGAFRDHADGAGGRDGGDGRVADLEFSFAVVNGTFEIRKHAPFLGQKRAYLSGLFLDEISSPLRRLWPPRGNYTRCRAG